MNEAPPQGPDLDTAAADDIPSSAPAEQVDRLYRAAWALCGSSVTAQTLLQQAYGSAPVAGGTLRRRDPLIALLRELRDAHLQMQLHDDDSEEDRPRRGAFDASGVYAAVAALPERYREALIAVDIVGLSYRDAATSLEVAPAALASRLLRAREHLARALTNDIAHLARTEPVMGALTPEEEGDLAAFADGSNLTNRDALAARIGRSPELQALIDDQHQALASLARAQHQAPERLRRSLPRASTQRARRAGGTAPLLLAFAGVVVLALIALRPGSSSGPPTLAQIAQLGARAPVTHAPARSSTARGALAVTLDSVAFPDLAALHWRAGGTRTDTLGGRTAVTVFYRDTVKPHYLVAYTMVSGKPLKAPSPAATVSRGGMHLLRFDDAVRNVVVWQRGDHSCTLSGVNVPTATLVRLATFKPGR